MIFPTHTLFFPWGGDLDGPNLSEASMERIGELYKVIPSVIQTLDPKAR